MAFKNDLKKGIGDLFGIRHWMTTTERLQILGGYACYGTAMYVFLKARESYKQRRINQRTYMSALWTAVIIALEGFSLELEGKFRDWFFDV